MLGIAKHTRAFFHRSPGDRALLVHAFALHVTIAVLFRLVRFGSLARALARAYPRRGGAAAPDTTGESRVGWAVATAVSFSPVGSTCLTTALTTQCLLRRSGGDAALRFGVLPGTRQRFAAHAWLESAGGARPEMPATADYLVLD